MGTQFEIHQSKMSSITTYILIFFSIILTSLYFYVIRKFDYWKKKGVQHKKPIPFFGNFIESTLFRKAPGQYLAEVYNETKGEFSGIYLYDQPCLVLKSLEIIKAVLIKDFNYFHDRYVAENHRDDPIGTYNLFNVKNPDWKELRTKITPIFTTGKLKQMFSLTDQNGEDLVKYIKNNISSGKSDDLKDIAAKFTIDLLVNTVFGMEANCLNDEASPFWDAGKVALTFTFERSIQFLAYFFAPHLVKPLKLKFIAGDATKFLRDVFEDSMKLRMKNNIKRNDLIDIIVKMKSENMSMNDNKLLAQCVIFFTAGFESASSTISYTLFELSLNVHIQNKLRYEIRTVLEQHDGKINYDVVMKMSYLHMVIQETLRKYPPLPFLDRKCMRKYTMPGTKLTIDEGVAVFIPLLGLHYDPKYFPNPQKYDPERFSDKNRKNIISGSYIPFGTGPHNCIGERFGLMSAKMGLIRILMNFEVVKNEKTPLNIVLDPRSFLVRSKDGIYIDFKPINIPAA